MNIATRLLTPLLALWLASCSAQAVAQNPDVNTQRDRAAEEQKAAERGPNSPPEILGIDILDAPIAGNAVSLEARIEKTDNDPYEIKWEQVTNPDRYSGSEFLSSSKLTINGGGEKISVIPEWPGKYRLKVKTEDKDGKSEKSIDLIVKFEKPPFEIRGIALNWWGPPGNNDAKTAFQMIDRAKGLGANFIRLAPIYYQALPEDNEMKSCSEFPAGIAAWCAPLPDNELRSWIKYAKSKEMGVLFNLLVDMNDENLTGHWRINPKNPDLWLKNYERFALKYAVIAQEEGVEWISIGNELVNLQTKRDYWTGLAEKIRTVYSGSLTYSDNRITRLEPRYYVTFWDKLDALAQNSFYSGSDKNDNPSVHEMQQFITRQMERGLTAEAKKYGKPIIITELGKPDYDGTNYDFTTTTGRIADTQEQADWAEAMLRALYTINEKGIGGVKGVFMWNMHLRQNTGRPGIGTRDFRNRPVEELVRIWFTP